MKIPKRWEVYLFSKTTGKDMFVISQHFTKTAATSVLRGLDSILSDDSLPESKLFGHSMRKRKW